LIDTQLVNKVSDRLKNNKLTIATAESCTGGMLANLLTNISGSSDYFERGIVSYSNTSKIELLDVDKDSIEKYGAVSKETAEAMAIGIRKNANVDIGISTTGIAGPTGGTDQKPIGLVYIGLSLHDKCYIKKNIFKGTRIEIKEESCNTALQLLLNHLK